MFLDKHESIIPDLPEVTRKERDRIRSMKACWLIKKNAIGFLPSFSLKDGSGAYHYRPSGMKNMIHAPSRNFPVSRIPFYHGMMDQNNSRGCTIGSPPRPDFHDMVNGRTQNRLNHLISQSGSKYEDLQWKRGGIKILLICRIGRINPKKIKNPE